ncbi:MAG: hypothetical protein JWP00_2397 [Chloroflexi bacterium]|nr:hypothetical protein [Chloroflexota bacterium]
MKRFIAKSLGINLLFVTVILCACGQLTSTSINNPPAVTPTQVITHTVQVERSSTPRITPTIAKTPSVTFSPAIFARPQSIKDIPIPPQASKVSTIEYNKIGFFVPTSVYKDFFAVKGFYRRELPPLGWEHCQTSSCANSIATATDTAYDSYKFSSQRDNGPFLQIMACPEEIVYCKEKRTEQGGFNVTVQFLNL